MEYGWGWGAGAGILCAHIGGWLLKPTKRLLGIKENKVSVATTVDPVSGAVCPTLAMRF